MSEAERIEVTVRVRRRRPLPPAAIDGRSAPRSRTYLNHRKLESEYGADPKDIKKVEDFARRSGLVVIDSSAARRSVALSGSASALGRAFGTKLLVWAHAGGTYRGRTGPVRLPAALDKIVVGVFGLDNRPFARPHFVRRADAAAASGGYTPPQVAKFYGFPTGVDGTGQVIGIIELGGGYKPADLQQYAKQLGVPVPTVIPVSVGKGGNHPTNANSADGEVLLDIEVASSIATGAKIVVYFAAGASDQDFLEAITQAVHDSTNKPTVISISWGGPEASAEASFQTEFDQVLQSAASLGITVTIASGDNGAADEGPNEWDNEPHADFPASSSYALGCGATNIQVVSGAITTESVWNQNAADTEQDSFGSSGGGVSEFFALPSFQAAAGVPVNPVTGKAGRGVPDVTGNGDPATGYVIRVDGEQAVIGGTSAVAPLWAALIALINQKLGIRAGYINPLLYANPGALRDITLGTNEVGSNGVGFAAGPGWDACSGLGSPNVPSLVAALGGEAPPAAKAARASRSAPPPPPTPPPPAPASHTLIVEPDDGRALVLQLLGAAKTSIDLTIYEISDSQIMAALTSAQSKGVIVRVLYNWYSFQPEMQQQTITPAVTALSKAGVQCRQAPRVFEVTHEKAFVIDGATAIIMSFNLVSNYFGVVSPGDTATRDFGIVTTVPAEVAEVAAVFDADWNSQAITPAAPSLVWSPVNSRAKLTALINGAKATLDVYCEEASDPGTLGALVAAAKRGVRVRYIAAVLSGSGKTNGNAQGVTFMNAGGVSAVCKSFLYIHAKMVLADQGSPGASAYIGSVNFSCTSLNDNRECGIIVTEAAILQRLGATYQSDWAQPSVAVVPDNSPLSPCPANKAALDQARIAQRQ